MPDSEILKHLPGWVFWVVAAAIFGGAILSRLVQGKKDFAELFGPPGRWLYRRAELAAIHAKDQRQAEFLEVFDTPVYQTLKRRIDVLEELVNSQRVGSERDAKRIKNLEIGAEHDAIRRDMDAEFIREDAQWHIDASMWAVENKRRLPQHRTYTQFVRDYRARNPESKKERE